MTALPGAIWRPLAEPESRYPWSVLWRAADVSEQVRAIGSVIASIPKGSYFDSNWAVTCGGFAAHYLLGTNLQYGGQQWVKGWRHSNKSQVGYVGVGWLTFRKFCTSTGC